MAWSFSRTDGGIVTNCKSETAATKPFFKHSWNHRRCIIPADGFYEWKQEGSRKQPNRFVLNSEEPFWFAGLWQPVKGNEIQTENEFVMLTKAANADVAFIHNRMPLLLRPDEIEHWLLIDSLEWVPEGVATGSLRAYPVSSLVSRPGWETQDCIAPFIPEASQQELFVSQRTLDSIRSIQREVNRLAAELKAVQVRMSAVCRNLGSIDKEVDHLFLRPRLDRLVSCNTFPDSFYGSRRSQE